VFRYEVTRIRPEYMRDVMPPKVAQREDLGDPVQIGSCCESYAQGVMEGPSSWLAMLWTAILSA